MGALRRFLEQLFRAPVAAAPAPMGPSIFADPPPAAPAAASLVRRFRLVAISNGLVFADPGGELAQLVGNGEGGGRPVLALATPALPGAVVLVAAEDSPGQLSMRADPDTGAALSYLLVSQEDAFALRHPATRMHVCAPGLPPGSLSHLVCQSREIAGWELFRLEPVAGGAAPAPDPAMLAAIEALGATPIDGDGLERWLVALDPAMLAAIGPAVVRAAPLAALRALAGSLLRDHAMRARVMPLLPEDFWSAEVLPQLLAWTDDRRPVSHLAIDERLDFLERDYVPRGGQVSTASLLNTLVRGQVEPRREIAIVASARNEGVYFLEWIAHHRAIGVEHFFIYSNYNDDGSDQLLDALARNGVITWIRNAYGSGVYNLVKAYAHHLSCLPQALDYRWTFVVDLDEFLVLNPDRYASLGELARARGAGGATSVSFSWKMYTIGGERRWSPTPLIERNLYSSGESNPEVKTMCRTRDFVLSWPHDPTAAPGVPLSFQDAAGGIHFDPVAGGRAHHGRPDYDHAWVNHYYYKSLDECLWKLARKRHDDHLATGFRIDLDAVMGQVETLASSTAHRDETALVHATGLARELAALRAMPGIAAAEEAVRTVFETRLRELRANVLGAFRTELAATTDEARRRRIENAAAILDGRPTPAEAAVSA